MEHTNFSYSEPTQPLVQQMAIRAVERLTGQPELKRLYELNRAQPVMGESFWHAAVRLLELNISLDHAALESIPKRDHS